MELAEKYAYKIYEKKSFSLAAKELFISQPALSSTISKLEGRLGFKIFDRTASPLSLTKKGRLYIDMLEEICEIEEKTMKLIENFSAKPLKCLGVGSSIHPAKLIFPEACKRFGELYPDVHVKLNMGEKGSRLVLFEQLEARDIDFLISYGYDEKKHTAIPITSSRFLIAARRDLPGVEALLPYALSRDEILHGSCEKEISRDTLPLFKDIPFITTATTTGYMMRIAEFLGSNYTLSRFSVTNVRDYSINYKMMQLGLGATLIRDIDLCDPALNDDAVVYFALKSEKSPSVLYAVIRKGEAVSEEALSFIRIFKDVLTEHKSGNI